MPRLVWPMKDAHSAKVVEELSNSCDPAVSEWGNPARFIAGYPMRMLGRQVGELKYLSTQKKRNRKRFP
jgi:hypothetical protein